MALAAFTGLPASHPGGPPLSVMRAARLAITIVDGSGSRSSSIRERATGIASIRGDQPRSHQRRKGYCTLVNSGKSRGSQHDGQADHNRYGKAFHDPSQRYPSSEMP